MHWDRSLISIPRKHTQKKTKSHSNSHFGHKVPIPSTESLIPFAFLTVTKTQTYRRRSTLPHRCQNQPYRCQSTSPHRCQNPTLPSLIHLASSSPKPTQNPDDSDAGRDDLNAICDNSNSVCDDSGVIRDASDAICNDSDTVRSQRFKRRSRRFRHRSRRFKSPIVGDNIMRQFSTLPATLQFPTLPATCNG